MNPLSNPKAGLSGLWHTCHRPLAVPEIVVMKNQNNDPETCYTG